MQKLGKLLMVYFAFVLAVLGIAIAMPHSSDEALLGAPIAAIGFTVFLVSPSPLTIAWRVFSAKT
jgi:hypothetical protein